MHSFITPHICILLVLLNDTCSEWKTLCKCMPQGSILGPPLFIVFINDFYFVKKCKLCNLLLCGRQLNILCCPRQWRCMFSVRPCLQYCYWLHGLSQMECRPTELNSNWLVLSPISPEPVSITSKENIVITSESCVKVFGILIDDRLDLSQHTSAIHSNAARQLTALVRISKYLDHSSLKFIHGSSKYIYCPYILVWHFCGKLYNSKIEKIQKRSEYCKMISPLYTVICFE